jgi:hypothetical protein
MLLTARKTLLTKLIDIENDSPRTCSPRCPWGRASADIAATIETTATATNSFGSDGPQSLRIGDRCPLWGTKT